MDQAKIAPFHLNHGDLNLTRSDGTAAQWTDIWKYQLPQKQGIVLRASDVISMYLEDTAPAEVGGDTCYVKIEVRDASEQDKRLVFGPALYARVKEFQDRNLMARLPLGTPLKVYERQWIVVSAKDDGTIDESDSHFDLYTSKVAVPLRS